MAIMLMILTILLMMRLGRKGRAYREEKRYNRFGPTVHQAKEAAYRKRLEREGLDDDLITIILPVVMSTK